jgi:uncharacterized protein (DUF983 family)
VQPASPSPRVSVLRALSRALHGRCPACGLSRVFIDRFRSERRCDACGWWFERGEGHWIGGSEINMIATFWTACPLFIAVNLAFGLSWLSMVLAGAFTVGFSLAIYQPSRCLFIAFDYLVDPRYDPRDGGGDGGDDGPGGPDSGPRIPPLGTRAPEGGNFASRR